MGLHDCVATCGVEIGVVCRVTGESLSNTGFCNRLFEGGVYEDSGSVRAVTRDRHQAQTLESQLEMLPR